MPIHNIINISAESVAAAACLILLLCVAGAENRKDKLNILFMLMLICNLIVLVSDITSWALERTFYSFTLPILHMANFFVYLFSYFWMAIMNYYIFAYISIKTPQAKKMKQTTNTLIFLCAILLLLIAQFNHMYYYFNENNVFQRGNLYWLAFIWSVFIFATDIVLIVKYWNVIGLGDSLALLSYILLPAIAVTIQLLFFGIMLIYIYMAFSMLVIYIRIHVQQSKCLKQQELELIEARIDVMLSQIQPHFLYNTLNTIKALITTNPEMAQTMVGDFSSYLRQNMESLKQKRPLPFNRELEHLTLYLDIEKQRFMERLNIIYDLDTTDFSLPVLTLQPLVENAVRHGITQKREGGTVTITTRKLTDTIQITVTDDGIGFDTTVHKQDGQSHIGLENVRQRLAVQCGGTLDIQSSPGRGTVAIISIPQEV